MIGEPDPSNAGPSPDQRQSAPDGSSEPAYDEFLREVDRMAADRQAANRRKRSARLLGLAALAVALVALGVVVLTGVVTAPH